MVALLTISNFPDVNSADIKTFDISSTPLSLSELAGSFRVKFFVFNWDWREDDLDFEDIQFPETDEDLLGYNFNDNTILVDDYTPNIDVNKKKYIYAIPPWLKFMKNDKELLKLIQCIKKKGKCTRKIV